MPLPDLSGAAKKLTPKPGKPVTARQKRNCEARAVMADVKKKTSPGEFVRQVRTETSKVVWPTRQETITTAIFVGIMMVILSLFFLGIDSAFGAVVSWLLTLA